MNLCVNYEYTEVAISCCIYQCTWMYMIYDDMCVWITTTINPDHKKTIQLRFLGCTSMYGLTSSNVTWFQVWSFTPSGKHGVCDWSNIGDLCVQYFLFNMFLFRKHGISVLQRNLKSYFESRSDLGRPHGAGTTTEKGLLLVSCREMHPG